jgi:hypothetical protein
MHFYLAWVDATETAFDPEIHVRDDESVYAFELSQEEGEFAKLRLDIRNPRVGLLAPGRKVWAWFSYDDGAGAAPLFFGRLVGIPTSIFEDVASLDFVARPADYAEQKLALAETLKVLPYWDPIFIDPDKRADPDLVLEGRSAVWHTDRLAQQLNISDVLNGEDGTVEFSEGEIVAGQVELTLNNIPLRSVFVDALIPWDQKGSGSLDLTEYIIARWPNEKPGLRVLTSFTFEGLILGWPQEGQSAGDGWVGLAGSELKLVNDVDTKQYQLQSQIEVKWPPDSAFGGYFGGPSSVTTNYSINVSYLDGYLGQMRGFVETGAAVPLQSAPGRDIVLPGIVTNASGQDNYDETGRDLQSVSRSVSVEASIIPLGRMTPSFRVGYDAKRGQGERVRFTLLANVQPVVTLPGEDETLTLSFNSVKVSDALDDGSIPIEDKRRRSYITLPRGLASIEHLIAVARANLVIRSRVVEITFRTTFAKASQVSLRKNATIHDRRLPGGVATGKVISTTFSLLGDTGDLDCRIKIGCSVGYGGVTPVSVGTPDYVEADYVETDYQYNADQQVPLGVGDVSYVVPEFSASDDGLDFVSGVSITDAIAEDLVVINPPSEQRTRVIDAYNAFVTANPSICDPKERDQAIEDALKDYATVATLQLRPLNRAFETLYGITTSMLQLPKQIDLEAESASS